MTASDSNRTVGRNPYVIGVPLTDTDGFYGRADTFHLIRDVLGARKQNVIVLYGQRRIGKTSLLHRAARFLSEGPFFPVYYDLQGKERLSLGEVLENLAQTLARRIELSRPERNEFDEDGRYFSGTFLPHAFARLGDKRLVLLIDEFDVLSEELDSPRAAAKTLFPYLQDLIATRSQIGFVFVVGRRIEELATHFQAIFKQAVYKRIGRLKPEESRALIVEPARGMITYDPAALEHIQKLAAGHPYFTQLICFEAFNAVRESQKNVTAEAVEFAATRAIETGHGALNWFWEGLPRAERFILSAVAHASDQSGMASKEAIQRLLEQHRIILSGLEFKDAPDRLVEWEMLRPAGAGAYQLVVEIVRRWVVKEHPLSSARRDIDHVSKRAVRLYENARDAHEQGELEYAREDYRRALTANPNHSGAQLGLALVLYELGDLDAAISEFERAYAIDEMSARDGLIRARLAKAEQTPEPEAAAAQYQKVLLIAPNHVTANKRLAAILMDRADAALQTSDLGAGTNAYRKALQLDHSREALARTEAAMLDVAARLEMREKHYQAAATAYVLVAELLHDPKRVLDHAIKFASRAGNALMASDRPELAVELYLKLLSTFSADTVLTELLQAAQQKITERKNVERIFNKARAAHKKGDFNTARNAYKQLIQLDVYLHKEIDIALALSEAVGRMSPASARKSDTPSATVAPSESIDSAWLLSYQMRVRRMRRIRRWALILVLILATCGAFYAAMPASMAGIYLSQPPPVKAGSTLSLLPTVRYDSVWRRRPASISATDFTWRSDNVAVAKVSGRDIKATGPGQATITASFHGVSGSTKVTVMPWSIAPLKANVTHIRFFQAAEARIPAEGLRKDTTRFAANNGPIFAELTLQIGDPAANRQLSAVLSYTIFRSGRLARNEWRVTTKANLPNAKTVVRLDFQGKMTPGRYSVTFDHDGTIFGSRDFEVY